MPLSHSWRRWYLRILPAYWVFLFLSTHLPRLEAPGPPQSDKLMHFVAFALLAFLFWRACQSAVRNLGSQFVFVAALVLSAYAALDEYLQQFVGRGTDVEDFLADVVGILVTLGVLEWQRRRQPRAAAPTA